MLLALLFAVSMSAQAADPFPLQSAEEEQGQEAAEQSGSSRVVLRNAIALALVGVAIPIFSAVLLIPLAGVLEILAILAVVAFWGASLSAPPLSWAFIAIGLALLSPPFLVFGFVVAALEGLVFHIVLRPPDLVAALGPPLGVAFGILATAALPIGIVTGVLVWLAYALQYQRALAESGQRGPVNEDLNSDDGRERIQHGYFGIAGGALVGFIAVHLAAIIGTSSYILVDSMIDAE